jgi:hypothetical protein
MKTAVITLKEYQGFQKAYDLLNRELFADSLPQVLVTLQRHANTRGYFSPERFKGEHSVNLTLPVAAVDDAQTPDQRFRYIWHNAVLTSGCC